MHFFSMGHDLFDRTDTLSLPVLFSVHSNKQMRYLTME